MPDPVVRDTPSARSDGLVMTAALGVYGLLTYVLLALVSRAVGAVRYADFSTFWGLVFGLGLGVFAPMEQEIVRRVAADRRRGESGEVHFSPIIRLGLLAVAVLTVGTAVAAPFLTRSTSDAVALACACGLAYAGLAVAYISRGWLGAGFQFRRYGVQLTIEAGLRTGVVLGLVLVGVMAPWPYAIGIGIALPLAVVLTARHPFALALRSSPVTVRDVFHSIIAIVVCQVAIQSLTNFGPVAIRFLVRQGEEAIAGEYLAAAVLARTPLLLYAAIQIVLLPRLVEAAARGDGRAFVRLFGPVGLFTIVIVGVAAAASATIGPHMVQELMGLGGTLSRSELTLLVAGNGMFMLALTLQPATIALHRHWAAGTVWVVASMAFVAILFVHAAPKLVVGAALTGSGLIASAGLGLVVAGSLLRRGKQIANQRT